MQPGLWGCCWLCQVSWYFSVQKVETRHWRHRGLGCRGNFLGRCLGIPNQSSLSRLLQGWNWRFKWFLRGVVVPCWWEPRRSFACICFGQRQLKIRLQFVCNLHESKTRAENLIWWYLIFKWSSIVSIKQTKVCHVFHDLSWYITPFPIECVSVPIEIHDHFRLVNVTAAATFQVSFSARSTSKNGCRHHRWWSYLCRFFLAIEES